MGHDPDRDLDELLRRRDAYIRHGVPAELSAGVRAWARRARLTAMHDAAVAAAAGLRRLLGCAAEKTAGRTGGEPAAITVGPGRFWQWVQRRRGGRLIKS